MKKLLLSLGSVAAIAAIAPLAISCSPTKPAATMKSSIRALKPDADLSVAKKSIDDIMAGTDEQAKFDEISKYYEGHLITLENTSKFTLGVEIASNSKGLNLSLQSKELLPDENVNATVELGKLVAATPKADLSPLSSSLNIKQVFEDELFNYKNRWNDEARLKFLEKYFEGAGIILENAAALDIEMTFGGPEGSETSVDIKLIGTNNLFVPDSANSGVTQTLSKRALITVGALQTPATIAQSVDRDVKATEIEAKINGTAQEKLSIINEYFYGSFPNSSTELFTVENVGLFDVTVTKTGYDIYEAGKAALRVEIKLSAEGQKLYTISNTTVQKDIIWM